MCKPSKVIKQTPNGFFQQCPVCRSYQISFGNIFLDLTPRELNHFKKFLQELDADNWERTNCSCSEKRKISIPTLQTNLQIMLSRLELEELKQLLGMTKEQTQKFISAENVDYIFVLN